MRIESKAHVGALSRSRPFHRLLEDVPECFDDLLLQQQAVHLARERARSARMVLDCTDEQTVQIESYLEGLRAQRRITYGLHRTDRALMTCLVFSLEEGRHVHFVDGAEGGYALAALQLKAQLRSDVHHVGPATPERAP
jgi:hypothetical protein